MTGSIFTKVSLGIGFMSLILIFGLGFMVQMGNEYGVTIEDQFQNNLNIQEQYVDIALETGEILEQGGLDQRTSDIAQLQGGIASQQNQLSNYKLLKISLEDLIKVFPYDPQFNIIIFGILTTMFVAGLIYLLFGRIG